MGRMDQDVTRKVKDGKDWLGLKKKWQNFQAFSNLDVSDAKWYYSKFVTDSTCSVLDSSTKSQEFISLASGNFPIYRRSPVRWANSGTLIVWDFSYDCKAVSETKILSFYVLFYRRWFLTRKMKRFTLDIWPTISSDSK